MKQEKRGFAAEELWLILTFLVTLATFALLIMGIYAGNMEACKAIWLVFMAALLSIPLRRRLLAGLGANRKNRR